MRCALKSQLTSLLTIIAVMFAGCTTPTSERVYVTHGPANPPRIKTVRYAGQYRLYSTAQRFPTVRNSTPVMEVKLNKGERIGFALGETGQVLAVIRDEKRPLTDSAATPHIWTLQADPGQFDPDRTFVLLLIVAVALIPIGFALTPDPLGNFGN